MKAAPHLKIITLENIKKGIWFGGLFVRTIVKHLPFGVNYDITWNCNLKCNHCYFISSRNELRNKQNPRGEELVELSDDTWINIFNYHRSLGIKSVSLTGGEPTLRMNLIKKAIEIFPSVQIASNGVIKLPRFKIKKQPIYWVSLDGKKKTHNQIRGADIFDKVINNIKNDERVLISTTITSKNYTEIEDIVSIAYNAGVSGLFFIMYTGYPGDPLLLKGEKLKTTVNNILRVMKDYDEFVLISNKMLELYITKEFVSDCIFKKGGVESYYPNGKRKFCVMGNSPLLCSNCGCIVPVATYALSMLDYETIEKIKKFPF